MINTSFIFPALLSQDECSSIIEFCSTNQPLENATVNVNGKYEVYEKARKSKVNFYPYQDNFSWLLDRIKEGMNEQISLKGFDINYETNFQFTHYGVGEYYGWHQDDSGSGPAANRAYSIVVQLSDKYEGGLLQFKKDGIQTFIPGAGRMIVFPSFWSHQVTPVTQGTRYSLVSWFSLKKQPGYTQTLL